MPTLPETATEYDESQQTTYAGDSAASRPNLEESVSTIKNDLKDAAQGAAEALKEKGRKYAQTLQGEFKKGAEQQKAQGADMIDGFAKAIDRAAEELQEQSPAIANYLRDAGHSVTGFSNNLREKNVDELMKEATRFARRQPALVVAGSVAVGFMVSRFLKSGTPASPTTKTSATTSPATTPSSTMPGDMKRTMTDTQSAHAAQRSSTIDDLEKEWEAEMEHMGGSR